MFLLHWHCRASSFCLAVSYLICGARFACLSHIRFYQGYIQIGKRTSLSGLVGLLYGLSRRTLTTRILPKIARPKARESLSNQQRSATASTVIRDRLGGLTCFSLNLIFLSLNRLLVLILYLNLSRKSSTFS